MYQDWVPLRAYSLVFQELPASSSLGGGEREGRRQDHSTGLGLRRPELSQEPFPGRSRARQGLLLYGEVPSSMTLLVGV
jgi:hypothetical protein